MLRVSCLDVTTQASAQGSHRVCRCCVALHASSLVSLPMTMNKPTQATAQAFKVAQDASSVVSQYSRRN